MESTSDRVKRLRRELGVTQEGLGALAGGITKSAVSQWERGVTEPQWEALHALQASKLVNPRWVLKGDGPMFLELDLDSHNLLVSGVRIGSKDAKRVASSVKVGSGHIETFMPITTWDDPSDLPEGQYVIIPRRRINLSAGNGNLVFEEEEAPGLAFTTQWVRQTGIKPSNAIVVYAKGDSMEPKIHDGDILLVDLAATQVRDGEVYAVRYNQEVRVKRLFCRYDDALILRSDNAAKYPDEIVPPEHQDGHVHILGRVIWRGGDV